MLLLSTTWLNVRCHSIWIDHLIVRLIRSHQLLEVVDPNHLALVLIHKDLPELVLVHLLWVELEDQVHHQLAIEVPWIDHVVHVQSLAVVKCRE